MTDWKIFVLLLVGLAQMMADAAGFPIVKAIAAATGASPAPKVFSTVEGLETFSTKFSVVLTDNNGATSTVNIGPELYTNLKGPYNRRNVYGAAFAYAPILAKSDATNPMFQHVLRYAFCIEPNLLTEIGVDHSADEFTLMLEPLPYDYVANDHQLTFTTSCHD